MDNDVNPVYKKLALAKAAIHAKGKIKAEGRNDFHKYDYIKPSQILDLVNPILSEYSLFVTFNLINMISFPTKIATSTTKDSVRTDSVNESPDYGVIIEARVQDVETDNFIVNNLYVPLDKFTPQGYGAVLTYVERYWYLKQFGIAQDDDDIDTKEQVKKFSRPAI